MSSLRRLAAQLLRAPLRAVPPDRPRAVVSGPLRGARWIPGAATHGCWLGIYERHVQRAFCRILRPGNVVYDLGANAGFFTLLASRLVGAGGAVVAVEPLPRNLDCLRAHLRLNGVANVTLVAAAAADASGSGFLGDAPDPSMPALAPRGLPVALVTLDELVLRRGLPRPDLLKIDVEGAESRVLRGAATVLTTHRPALVLSCHGWREHEACQQLLAAHGYRVETQRDGSADGNYGLLAAAR